MFVYVEAALNAGVYRLGMFSLAPGSRSVILSEQPPN